MQNPAEAHVEAPSTAWLHAIASEARQMAGVPVCASLAVNVHRTSLPPAAMHRSWAFAAKESMLSHQDAVATQASCVSITAGVYAHFVPDESTAEVKH